MRQPPASFQEKSGSRRDAGRRRRRTWAAALIVTLSALIEFPVRAEDAERPDSELSALVPASTNDGAARAEDAERLTSELSAPVPASTNDGAARADEAAPSAQGEESLEVTYRIDARLSQDLRSLQGRLRIDVHTAVSLESLRLLFYPAHLNPRDPRRLNDLVFPRVYPGAFDEAALTFEPRMDGRLLTLTPAPAPPGWDAGTLLSMRLPAAVPAGSSFTIEGDFHLRIPHRYGLFGRAARQVTLAGGWFPMLVHHDGSGWDPQKPLPVAGLELSLRYPSSLIGVLDGRDLEVAACTPPAAGEQCARGASRGRAPVLVLGTHRPYPLEDTPIVLYDPINRPYERRVIERLVHRAAAVWTEAGLPPPGPTSLVRAPLRRTLAVPFPGRLVLVSDRALRVFPGVRRYHTFPLLQAIYRSWMMQLRASIEPADDLVWVADGLAWYLVQAYRDTITAGEVQFTEIIRPLSFIPTLDEMLYSPKFAFAGEMYDSPYTFDPLREALDDFRAPVPGGRALFMKLEDRFGREAVAEAAKQALGGGSASFVTHLARRVHAPAADVQAMVDAWKRPYPRVNYRIADVKRARREGSFETSIQLEEVRVDGPPPDEPVTVRATTLRRESSFSWDGDGKARAVVKTDEPVLRVVVDPQRRLLEASNDGVILRDDNYWPKQTKLLFTFVPSSLDLSVYKAQGIAALYLTRPHTRDWLCLLEALTDSQVRFGSTLGAFRYFGPYRDSLWRKHRVGVQAVLGHRAGGAFFDAPDAFLDTYGVRVSYRFESRITLQDSRTGGYFSASFEEGYARSDSGGEESGVSTHPYSVVSLAGIKLFALHPRHILAIRGQIDAGFGLDPGEQEGTCSLTGAAPGQVCGVDLFTLGGGSALRAIGGETDQTGNRRWLTSIEYRALVLEGLDIDFLAVRGRAAQVALFSDIGAAGDTIDALRHPIVGYGFGLRFFADILGLKSGMLGIDLAWEAGGEPWPRPILRFSQPF